MARKKAKSNTIKSKGLLCKQCKTTSCIQTSKRWICNLNNIPRAFLFYLWEMEKLNGYIGHVVKTVIFLILLTIFSVLYLQPVMKQYSEKLTNIAKISKKSWQSWSTNSLHLHRMEDVNYGWIQNWKWVSMDSSK